MLVWQNYEENKIKKNKNKLFFTYNNNYQRVYVFSYFA